MSGGNIGYAIFAVILLPFILGFVASIVLGIICLFGVVISVLWIAAPTITGLVLSGVIYIVLALKNG